MLGICKLRNSIQTYAWGSHSGIAGFLGREPADEPQAELWMGAHPQAPSEIEVGGRWMTLVEVIHQAPQEVLGPRVAALYDRTLPFLLKVLAAGRALSIQAHPDRQQAAAGFEREEELGIPRDAGERNYRDSSHKPEIFCAVTPFKILRGFRPAAEILGLMRRIGLEELLSEECEALRHGDLKRFFSAYMSLDSDRLEAALGTALARINDRLRSGGGGDSGALACVLELDRQFPGDRGVLAPLYLHFVELGPGEAIFTPPGVLHAYLEGLGIELMANSDNVVRGGLTSKHVDVRELVDILRFEAQPPRLLSSVVDGGVRRFETVADELDLAVIEIAPGETHERGGGRGVEILLCAEGGGVFRETATSAEVEFAKGDSFLVPAAVPGYRIEGNATLFRAGLP